ncbi:long-chain-fatty-acid--CoA ligase [Paenibacillus thermotolerans]|uniref:long-chain-fatty-acid--CoA ligase n=1 Tax=Paenibacillus thermotolerans TaxID=3027807 RepID=UPI002367B981|nr:MULTISPECIES: long-chain fatty acid--CoA ligase [unclassified Paenibacillus]
METKKPWLSSYPEEVAPTFQYPKHNVAKLLLDAADRFPARPAIQFMGAKLNYRQLENAAYRFANGLRRIGIGKGDRVAIMLPNCPQAVIAYFGTLLAGGIVVQTNPLYKEHELRHQLEDSGAKAIVVLNLLFKRVQTVLPRTRLRHIIVTSIADYLPFPKNLLYPIKVKRDGQHVDVPYSDDILAFKRLLATSPATPIHEQVDAERDTALLQYTGGTTGISKGVMLTHFNLVANTYQNIHWSYKSVDGEERFLAALPLFHVFGLTVLMNQAVLRGSLMILLPRFEADTVLQTIDRLKPTTFPGAPTMYIALINHPKIKEYDLSSIKVCVSGSSALPLEVQETFENISGGRLIEGYGLTEASPVTHANPIWGKRKIGSIGVPFPDTEAKIVNPDTGEELPAGEIGEVIVRGPQVMKGYWNRPDETEKVLKDGWLYTGDMGKMDEDGFFMIVDRKKDVIIASGFNVYPRDVEEVLFEHPAVREAVVAGVPDKYRGETVKAYIVVKEGAAVTGTELEAWCRERLAAYKVPRLFEFRESLPKTMIGKVLRRALIEEENERLSNGEAAADEAP